MANDLVKFEDAPQLPAELAEQLQEVSNLVPIATIPSLSYEGKIWTISIDGKRTPLMRRNADDEEEPIATFKGVILDYAKNRGRAYYEGAYDPKNAAMPKCWSDDGKVPSEHVREPQCSSCGKCPLAVKGSKITEQGKEVKACSEFRMVALVPYPRIDFEPLRLKIAITSDWDGQRAEDDWYGFKNYTDMLKSRGVAHTAQIMTKIKFDSTAYPKLLFSKGTWLSNDELAKLLPVIKSEKVKDLISKSWTPNGVDGHRHEEEDAPPKPKEEVKPKVKPPADEDDDMPLPAAKKDDKPKAAPKEEKPKIEAKAAPKEEKPKAAPKEEKVKPKVTKEVEDAMEDILGDWA